MLLYGNTVKFTLLVKVPVGVVTVTGPVVAPAGSVAFINVPRTTLKEDAGTPLKLTAVVPVRSVPRIWITEPTLPLVTTNVTNGPRPRSKLNTVPQPMESRESQLTEVPPWLVVP